ncbi:hypothetical protein K7X08_021500 [Anisodus acutangulus]|uniref:IP5PC-F beta-propeller domain-containing protein n=1 Tax=Anisodus acutangulus TaxID=402998 RepID=A0A9Q1REF4_9SOLA|nr:hypothetical protein K7X08_021500 [Anisodus acutangulus]
MEPTPRKKAHSYSHQLRTNTRTHHKCYHQFRHHSFDIPTNIIQNNHGLLMYEDSSSSDEDFYPYSTYSTTTGASTTGHVFDAPGKGLKTVDDDINEQQALPEFLGGDGGVGIFKVIYGQGPRVVTLGFGHGNLLRNLSLSPEERHMAALLVERLFVDLRSQVTVNGVCNISSSDVKCLLSDHVKGKVWAAGLTSFSLWNAQTRELLKVYNAEGQIENRADMSSVQEQATEDKMNSKYVS